jgi:hypothetical protein
VSKKEEAGLDGGLHRSAPRADYAPYRDRKLREQGAEISERPRVGEPRWRYGGRVYAESELVRILKL